MDELRESVKMSKLSKLEKLWRSAALIEVEMSKGILDRCWFIGFFKLVG
jgi:hypothetical protein